MERTLAWKLGGQDSEATLARTRSDLTEVTWACVFHPESEEVRHAMAETASNSLSVELSGTWLHREESDGRGSHSQSHLCGGCSGPPPALYSIAALCAMGKMQGE